MTFSVFNGSRDFHCFKCGAPFESVEPSGFAPRQGEYKGKCEMCGLYTYFDAGQLNGEDMAWPEWFAAAMPSWLTCCSPNAWGACCNCPRCDRKYAPAVLVNAWLRGDDPTEWRATWFRFESGTSLQNGLTFERMASGRYYLVKDSA